jgi:hypothetical protein
MKKTAHKGLQDLKIRTVAILVLLPTFKISIGKGAGLSFVAELHFRSVLLISYFMKKGNENIHSFLQ